MNIVIIEDEQPAAEKLVRYLSRIDSNIIVSAHLTSVAECITWFETNNDYELIFMDIQLTDGISFEIFNKVNINSPIIFTTAYDEYAIDAFKVNGIDYILKPITFTELSKAFEKFKSLKASFNKEEVNQIGQKLIKKKVKDRFLVKIGNNIQSVPTSEVAYFFADGRTVFLYTNENKRFIIEYKLQQLEEMIDPQRFFRVNRSFILNVSCIDKVSQYSNSRLIVKSKIPSDKDIIVSREKVNDFKLWMGGVE